MTPPKPLLLTEEVCDALWEDTTGYRCGFLDADETEGRKLLQSAAALGARKTLEMVRDYHRKGGEVHETWLHKRIREMGGDS